MNNNKCFTIIIACLIGASLLGCSVLTPETWSVLSTQPVTEAATEENTSVCITDAEDEASRPFIEKLIPDGSSSQEEAHTEISKEEIAFTKEEQIGKFVYERLNDQEQQLYAEIFTILNNMETDKEISTLNSEPVDRIFQCVMSDHPDLFYVDGYYMTKFTTGGKISSIEFSGKYMKTTAERERAQDQIDSYVNHCMAGIPPNTSDYEKVKYIYEYLVQNTEYSSESSDNQNICSVFLEGKSVCQGYAKATQYLLELSGVPCTLISGTVKNGESHAWNLAYVDGVWCYIDTTWGDAFINTEDGGIEQTNDVNYDYLCVDDEILGQTHQIKTTLMLPVCDSLQNYYYVREGTYFTSYDEARIEQLFSEGYEQGKEKLTLKCASGEIYQEMLKHLIEQQKVFELLHSSSIKYMTVEDSHTITFYL